VARAEGVEAVESLRRRSLLEWGPGGTFTLQPVVLEHITARLVDGVADEVLAGEPRLMLSHALVKASARDYVRRSQERLIAEPLLERLHGTLASAAAVERQLLALLDTWRGRPAAEQDYGPGNVVNLLRLLRGDLSGLDLSRLSIRQAYLQEAAMQDASLAHALVSESVLGEAFGAVTSIAVSADGHCVSAGMLGGDLRVWRLVDRLPLLSVQGHSGGVWGVALSADGRVLASGGQDGTVRLWEVQGGRSLATLRGHSGDILGVALSADRRLLASGSLDGTVRLWDATSGQALATLQGHGGGVWGVALSADGRLLASGSLDGTVRLWDATSGQALATLQGHGGGVWGVALSADGRLLASGSLDGKVRLWDATSGQPLATLQAHAAGVYGGLTLSADGRVLASGSLDGVLRLWEAPSGQALATLQAHGGGVVAVALSSDGRLLASGGQEGTVRLWEAPSGQALATLQGRAAGVYGVALSADGRLLASCGIDMTVRLWDAAKGQPLATLQGHGGGVWAVALSADGRLLASAGQDGTARLWEAPSGQPLVTLRSHDCDVLGVALSADGQVLASGGLDGTVRVWDAASGKPLATLQAHRGAVRGLSLSADGRVLASGGQDCMARLWEVPSGQPLVTLRCHGGEVWDVALTADGRVLASGSLDETTRLWDAASGQRLATLRGHGGAVRKVALSADGRLLASGNHDGTVQLWEVASGQALATLRGHTAAIWGVAFAVDGRLLASGDQDGTITLWDASRSSLLHTLRLERPYERLDITGVYGVTEAQQAALLALGAVDHAQTPPAQAAPRRDVSPPPTAPVAAPGPAPAQPLAVAGTPSRPPTNLPPSRTTFVGRTADVASVTHALDPTRRTGARLLTLTGLAGCGKTRLALAVAGALRDAYGDGVWLVELAPLPAGAGTEPRAVVAAILTALGLHEQPDQGLLETLISYLQSRRALMLLDNCEHVVAACAGLVPRLLGACPGVQILATSQLPLGTTGETVQQLAALPVPDPVTGTPTDETLRLLAQSEAVQLFMQRAQAVQPGFALSTATATSVAAICMKLDGLPLAIELAAARLSVLSLEEILARLDDRFRLLRLGGRSADVRHQTLQATLDWSYGLLDPVEQAVVRRLAVFSGGWDLAAAEAVCAGDAVAEDTVLDVLDELLDRSLVNVYEAGGVPRYGMLETVRQYGLQQLEHAGEVAAVRDRHLDWCVALAEQAAPALQGPVQIVWLARLSREHDNLRAALQWALDRGRGTLGLRVAGGLGKFWLRGDHQREGRRWLEALLALAADNTDTGAAAARATALEAAAWLAEDRHDFAQASALFAQAGAMRRGSGEEMRPAGVLITDGLQARADGDYARAAALMEESLAQASGPEHRGRTGDGELGLSVSWGNHYTLPALVLRERGEYARARALCEECLALARERGDAESIAIALLSLGDIARDLGEAARVSALCEESLALFRNMGQKWAIGFLLNDLALAAYLDGDLALAASRATESESVFREMEAETSLAEVLVTVGRVRGAQGEWAAARASLAEALTLALAKGPRLFVAASLEEIGVQAVGQGYAQHGVPLLAAAATLRQVMGAPPRPVDRPGMEAALAAARMALGLDIFDQVWAAGQALPLEQAIGRALAGPEGGAGAGEWASSA
jgi:WD40 repeat protein/predicted ATPase